MKLISLSEELTMEVTNSKYVRHFYFHPLDNIKPMQMAGTKKKNTIPFLNSIMFLPILLFNISIHFLKFSACFSHAYA